MMRNKIFFEKNNWRGAQPVSFFHSSLFKIVALLFIITIFSCKDDEVNIASNEAPPDGTVENVTIGNYVNRAYIAVLGREADSTEKEQGFNLLRAASVSNASRHQFLDLVFAKPTFNDHLYTVTRSDLLQSMDTLEIPFQMFLDSMALLDSALILYWDVIQQDLVKLDSMRNIPRDMENDNLDIAHLHIRCVNNYFYDQLNMGTENFVKAVFLSFLQRSPTEYELEQSKKMVDGTSGILFLQSGISKNDFLNIFFSSQNYYEGLSTNLYIRYLHRSPSSTEMGDATLSFLSNHDYKLMQKDILSKNEYIFK